MCFGGSNDGSWSLNGSSSRCSSMRSLTSSPSSGTGNPGNGPLTELHDENVAGVVVHRDRLVVAGDHHDVVVRFALHRALPPQVLVVRVRIRVQGPVEEEVDVVEVGHGAPGAMGAGDPAPGDRGKCYFRQPGVIVRLYAPTLAPRSRAWSSRSRRGRPGVPGIVGARWL